MNDTIKSNIKDIVQSLVRSYGDYPVSSTKMKCKFPSKTDVIEITDSILELIFPGYSGEYFPSEETLPYYVGDIILTIEQKFANQIYFALSQENCSLGCKDTPDHHCGNDADLRRRA